MQQHPSNSGDDANTPIKVTGDSPDRVDIPIWLAACIQFDPPRRPDGKPRRTIDGLYPTILLLMSSRIGARPDEAIRLDRQSIAHWAGARSDKITWITQYLQRVGFIDIYRRWTKSGRGSDVFDIHVRPPAGYVGPQTAAELDTALRSPSNLPALFSPGQSQNPTSGVMGGSATPQRGGNGAETPGQSQNPTSGVMGGSATPQRGGNGAETPGQSQNPTSGVMQGDPYIGDTSGISVGEIPEVDEATAPPRSAGRTAPRDDVNDWARQLVGRLPWRERGRAPNQLEAIELAAKFRAAVDDHGLIQDDVREWALNRLDAASRDRNPVAWVTGGFEPKRLPAPGYASLMIAEPLSDSPLPLPSATQAANEPSTPVEDSSPEQGASEPDAGEPADESRAPMSAEERAAIVSEAQRRATAKKRRQRRARFQQDTETDTDDQQAS